MATRAPGIARSRCWRMKEGQGPSTSRSPTRALNLAEGAPLVTVDMVRTPPHKPTPNPHPAGVLETSK